MPRITLSTLPDFDWVASDELLLMVGDENAADLASSTPAGGVEKTRVPAWGSSHLRSGFGKGPFGRTPFGYSTSGFGFGLGGFGTGAFGTNNAPLVEISATVFTTDPTAVLPVGVKAADQPGNVSSVSETLVGLNEPPRGARNLTVSGRVLPGEAALNWQ